MKNAIDKMMQDIVSGKVDRDLAMGINVAKKPYAPENDPNHPLGQYVLSLLKQKYSRSTKGVSVDGRFVKGIWVDDKIVKNLFVSDHNSGATNQVVRTRSVYGTEFSNVTEIDSGANLWWNSPGWLTNGIGISSDIPDSNISLIENKWLLNFSFSFGFIIPTSDANQINQLFFQFTTMQGAIDIKAYKSAVSAFRYVVNFAGEIIEVTLGQNDYVTPLAKMNFNIVWSENNKSWNLVCKTVYENSESIRFEKQINRQRLNPFYIEKLFFKKPSSGVYGMFDLQGTVWENGI